LLLRRGHRIDVNGIEHFPATRLQRCDSQSFDRPPENL
jgi:hypothetical protein